MKTEEANSVSKTTSRSSDNSNSVPGKDIFWSSIYENYALLETVDLSIPSPPKTGAGSFDVDLEIELRDAQDTIADLKKENVSLQNHIVQLEVTRSSG